MLKETNIVCLAGCEWEFTWQPTQEIMLRMAQAGNRVLYVQPTGTRTLRFSDWRRVWERLKGKAAGVKGDSDLPPSLTIYAPLMLPFPYGRLARKLNQLILLSKVDRWVRAFKSKPLVFWFYFPSPLNADLMESTKGALTIYQVMSSAEAVRPHPDFIEANSRMLSRCDLVLANSGRLRAQAAQRNCHVHLFRAGVNLGVFESGVDSERPAELKGLAGPLIGYAGALHQWVDVELMRQTAVDMPDCQFVFVGPAVRDVSALRAQPNVHMLGQKPHGELPRYLRHFDVCVIPYVCDAYTETAYPAKLNEYLALGKPVVATVLPELEDYNREFGNVIRLAGDQKGFSAAIREALRATDEGMREIYRLAAKKNAWSAILESMSKLIEERVRTRERGQEASTMRP